MENVQNILQAWGEKIVSALKAALPPEKDPAGLLGQSIVFSIDYAGFPIVFELQLADYYKFIDSGRAAGKFPPPSLMANWIKNKQLTLNTNRNSKGIKSKMNTAAIQSSNIKSLTFLIGRKIARQGIPATHFYSDTLNDDALQELNAHLSAAFKQDVLAMISA